MARQRGNKWQADALIDGRRQRKSFATLAAAEAWEAEHATPDGRFKSFIEPAPEETLRSLAKRLQADLWGTGDNSIVAMRHVGEAIAIIGDVPVSAMNNVKVQQLTAAYMKAGNSDGTINRKYASLSKLLKSAVDTDLLVKLPKFKRRKEPKGRDRFLTYKEEDKLFGHLKEISEKSWDLAVLLVDSGARLAEPLSLGWYQVNLDATALDEAGNEVVVGTITFDKTKADVTRTIYMTSRMRAILLRREGLKSPFADLNRWTFRDHWQRARKLAGFEHDPDIVPHILRHTCASRIVQGRHSLKTAQTQLGHKHPAMTNRYAHLALDSLSGVVKTLERT